MTAVACLCPSCGTTTELSKAGHVTLCLPCTEVEIGETYETLRDRATVTVHKGAKKKWHVTSASGGSRSAR